MAFIEDALRILGDIGTNKQNLKLLADCRERLIPFVGAGLSIPLGYPSWNDLLQNFAASVGLGVEVKALLAELKFEEAAELIAKTASVNYLDDSLRSVFDHSTLHNHNVDAWGAVRHLPKFARNGVLTTNFDRVLETVYEDRKSVV